MADGDGDATNGIRCLSEVRIEVSDFVLVDFINARIAVSLGIDDVFAEKLLIELLRTTHLS